MYNIKVRWTYNDWSKKNDVKIRSSYEHEHFSYECLFRIQKPERLFYLIFSMAFVFTILFKLDVYGRYI